MLNWEKVELKSKLDDTFLLTNVLKLNLGENSYFGITNKVIIFKYNC